MKRADAEKLIGARVQAWTAMNGRYVGVLVKVFGRPWRGAVEITGVLDAAVPYEANRTHGQRKGLRVGDVIEIGGSSIRPTEALGKTYLEALIDQKQKFQDLLAPEGGTFRDVGWINRSLEEIEARIAEERSKPAQD